MKYLYSLKWTVTLCLFGICSLMAQTTETVTIPLSNPNEAGKLVTHIVDGSITVKGYGGTEVIVEAQRNKKSKGRNNSKHKSNREGMHRVTENSLEFTIEEINNTVYIKHRPGKYVIDFVVSVPHRFSVDLKTVNQGIIHVEEVDGMHEVSNTNGPITMNKIGGSVIADALNRDIIIGFDRIDSNANMMFTSLNGNVDVKLPKSLKVNVMARSDNGDVYTDFELVALSNKQHIKKTNSNGVYRVKREKGISGSINGGGPDMTFKTLNGDIFIRSN